MHAHMRAHTQRSVTKGKPKIQGGDEEVSQPMKQEQKHTGTNFQSQTQGH